MAISEIFPEAGGFRTRARLGVYRTAGLGVWSLLHMWQPEVLHIRMLVGIEHK